MKSRPSLAASSLLVIAILHVWWGGKMLLASNLWLAGTQLVGAGGLIVAAVGLHDRRTAATGLTIMGVATLARLFVIASDGFGPFAAATTLMGAGFLLSAWGHQRVARRPPTWEPLAMRGGLLLTALAYATFLGLGFAQGSTVSAGTFDFVARTIAAILAATFLDAPTITLARRKTFPADASSAR